MARHNSGDTTIGQRIKDRRELFKWSIRFASDRAGINASTWSRIENGKMSADNRFVLAAIAEALRCPVADLTGLPADPVNRDQVETGGAIYETVRAILDTDLEFEPSTAAKPIEELACETRLALDLRTRCDYSGSAARLPDLFRALHAAAYVDSDRAEALRLMVIASDVASFVIRYAGHPGSSCLAADRGKQAARESGDRVMIGLAAYGSAHAATGCGLYGRALTIAERAASQLEPHLKLSGAPEVVGQLHLTSAYSLCALGREDEAVARIDAAQELAARTGDTDSFHLMFGPTNINFWRISMDADGDDPGKAVELARTTNPQRVNSATRHAAFYLDTGRALARIRKDQEALRMLLLAERMAPQRMQSPLVVEMVRSLRERARRGSGWTELRGLCERMGLGT
jgi:transcriptional regulator with XRE-family HTH domain